VKTPTPATATRTPEDEEAAASAQALREAEADAPADGEQRTETVLTSGESEDAAAEALVRAGKVAFEDNGRADVARGIASRRGQDEPDEDEEQEAEPAPADGDEAEQPATVREPGEAAPVTARAAPKRINVAELDPDAIVQIKVNGRILDIAAGDLVGNAQKYFAGEDHLRASKEILDSARRTAPPTESNRDVRPASGQNQPERRDAQPPVARTAKTKVDPKDLVGVVDKIATGTAEDGAAALADVLNRTVNGAENQGDVEQVVDQRLNERDQEARFQAESKQAISDLRAAHPALDRMPSLTTPIFQIGYETMVENLRAIGVPDEQMRALKPPQIIKEYVRLSHDPEWGSKLKPMKDVYEDATVAIEKEVGIQPSAKGNGGSQPVVRTTEARVVRKTTTPIQPRSAGIRAEPGAVPVARERNAGATIAALKTQREEGLTLRR
jgi:hypothetical protein